jgi:hypothetical protein
MSISGLVPVARDRRWRSRSPRCSRLGQPVAGLAAEQVGAQPCWQPYRMLHKLFHKESVMADNASRLFRSAPYVVFGCMVLACVHRARPVDRPAAGAGGRCHRAGGLFALARVFHLAGGDGCRHGLRHAGRAARDADRLPGRAGAADGAVLGVADLDARRRWRPSCRRPRRNQRARHLPRAWPSPAWRSRWCRWPRTRACRWTTRPPTSS